MYYLKTNKYFRHANKRKKQKNEIAKQLIKEIEFAHILWVDQFQQNNLIDSLLN